MTRKKPWQTLRARLGRASGIALSYTMFLFVCLSLLVIIVVSLLTKEPPKEVTDDFDTYMELDV